MESPYRRSSFWSVLCIASLFLAFVFLVLLVVNDGEPNEPPRMTRIETIPQHYPGIGISGRRPMNIATGKESIRGLVLDAAGNPLADIPVFIDRIGDGPEKMIGSPLKGPRWTSSTNAAGEFEITRLPAADFIIMALRPDAHALTTATLSQGGPAAECFLTLGHSVAIAGQARNTDGLPLAEAWVYPVACDNLPIEESRIYGWLPTRTDARGRFALPHLPYGRWRVLVLGPKGQRLCSEYLPPLPVDRAFDIREGMLKDASPQIFSGPALAELLTDLSDLPQLFSGPACALAGQVLEAQTGRGQARIKIRLTETEFGVESFLARSEAQGRFHIDGLRPGNYEARVIPERYASIDAPLLVSCGPDEANTDLVIRVDRGARIRGRVLTASDAVPLPGVTVALKGEGVRLKAQTDLGGYYQFTALPKGGYTLWAPPQGTLFPSGAFAAQIDVDAETYVEGPVFKAGEGLTLRGYVSNDQSQQRRGANVFLAFEAARAPVRAVRSSQDGSFAFHGLQAGGKVWVWAEYLGRSSALFGPVSLEPDTLADIPLAITLPCRGRIEGILLDATNTPVSFTRVWCKSTPPDEQQCKHCTTDSRGGFRFDRLTPGAYQLYCDEGKGELLQVDLKADAIARQLILHTPK